MYWEYGARPHGIPTVNLAINGENGELFHPIAINKAAYPQLGSLGGCGAGQVPAPQGCGLGRAGAKCPDCAPLHSACAFLSFESRMFELSAGYVRRACKLGCGAKTRVVKGRAAGARADGAGDGRQVRLSRGVRLEHVARFARNVRGSRLYLRKSGPSGENRARCTPFELLMARNAPNVRI